MPNQASDRDAIRECIYRSARAIDRCDEDTFWTAYWPEAVHTGVGLTLALPDFVAMAVPALRTYDGLSHMVGNILIKLADDRAVAESYVFSYHRHGESGSRRDNLQAGRYLDRLERRGGEWKILERTVVIDWFRDFADTGDWAAGPMGNSGLVRGGGPGREDPSHALFASLP
jgi:hypothetical protein